MENPWGSPWTADAPPKLDLPAPPPHAHFNLEHGSTNHSSPQRLSPNRLPWDDDDAWGGWSDAKAATSPGWGRSPGLKPVDEPVEGLAPPSPALGAGLDVWSEAEIRRAEESEDSGISLPERQSASEPKEAPLNVEDMWRTADTAETIDNEPRSEAETRQVEARTEASAIILPDRQSSSKPQEAPLNAEDMGRAADATETQEVEARQAEQVSERSPRPSASDDDTQSSTSDVPPRLALPPGTRPAVARQTSKVQDLVVMFDGIAKRNHSVSPSPVEPPKRMLSEVGMVEAVSDGLERSDHNLPGEEVEDEDDDDDDESESDEQSEDDEEFADFKMETKIDKVIAEEVKEEPKKPAGADAETLSVEESPADVISQSSPVMKPETIEKQRVELPENTTLEQGLASSTEAESEEEEESSSGSDLEPPTTLGAKDGLKDSQEPEDLSEEAENITPGAVAIQQLPETPTREPSAQPKISYIPNLSQLDDLFPSVDADFPAPEPVPDIIIDDTFASITERKAWYRMSRFGSIQMHNSGDENYTRTTWHNSTVRDRSIRIVRRWMEEDSIAGRVVLGRRTAASGKIFNWDSSAPQVEIKELLNRKSHARQESFVTKEPDFAASPSVAIPAFGWSSTSSPTFAIPPPLPYVSPTTQTPPAIRGPRASSPVLQKLSEPTALARATASPISPLGQPPITISYEAREEEESKETDDDSEDASEDDDDDWGEMVTSPTVEASNAIPSLAEVANNPPVTSNDVITPITSVVPSDDLFGDFAAPNTADKKPKQAPPPNTWDLGPFAVPSTADNNPKQVPSSDTWGFGDMSFFEGAPPVAQVPMSTPTPPPARKQTDLPMPLSIMTPMSPISISSPHTTFAPPVSPPAPPAPKQDILQDTSHDDEIVANILRDLPNLSYMLR